MASYKRICTECGKEFYSRSSYIVCEHCMNVIMYGSDPVESTATHTTSYYDKTFKQLNERLLEECRRADACGKSYGYYKADNRRILRDGIR